MPESVFISYSRWNRWLAERLHADLGRAGVRAWLDTDAIAHDRVWGTEIERGIEAADRVVVLASPESVGTPTAAGSEFVRRELEYADTLAKPRVVVRVAAPAARLPDDWERRQMRDFSGRYADELPWLLRTLSADRTALTTAGDLLDRPGLTAAAAAADLWDGADPSDYELRVRGRTGRCWSSGRAGRTSRGCWRWTARSTR